MKKSAGVLVYQRSNDGIKVLIVHSSGREDLEPWSIPKGEFNPPESTAGKFKETPRQAAVREVQEELGISVQSTDLVCLGASTYRNKSKRVYCFCCEVQSAPNLVLDEREIKRAEFFSIEDAKRKLHEAQTVFLDRLLGLDAMKQERTRNDLFRLEIHPAENDDLSFGLVFNGTERPKFWGTDYSWSLFWDATNIADVASKLLKGEIVEFGNIAGSGSGDQYLRFIPDKTDGSRIDVMLVEKPWPPGFGQNSSHFGKDSKGHLVIDSLQIQRDVVVLQFVRCFIAYLDFLSRSDDASASLCGHVGHEVLKDPRIRKLCKEAGLNVSAYLTDEERH